MKKFFISNSNDVQMDKLSILYEYSLTDTYSLFSESKLFTAENQEISAAQLGGFIIWIKHQRPAWHGAYMNNRIQRNGGEHCPE